MHHGRDGDKKEGRRGANKKTEEMGVKQKRSGKEAYE